MFTKVLAASILLIMVNLSCANPPWWDEVKNTLFETGHFTKGMVAGAVDMLKSYNDMKNVNMKAADKYFKAKGNYEAQKHGAGGRFAAEILSNALDKMEGRKNTDMDREATIWGQHGGSPERFRPDDLPDNY